MITNPTEPYRSPTAPSPVTHPRSTRSTIVGWWCVANMLLIVIAYSLLILYPVYASGLYLETRKEIWANEYDVPLFGTYGTTQNFVITMLAMFADASGRFIATPMAILVAFLAYRERRNLGWLGGMSWLLVALLVPAVVWLTQNDAEKLFIWVID